MIENNVFYWNSVTDKKTGVEFIILGYKGMQYDDIEAWVAPAFGSNLCRLSIGEKNIIDFDTKTLLNRGYTGTPVLYPTPNLVRNSKFTYKGMTYNQIKRGKVILEHGLVHDEAWKYSLPVLKDTCVSFSTWIDFDNSNELFKAFPFRHRLSLEFSLFEDGIKILYSIENMDNMEIPFGIGLHPYFMKLSGEENMYIKIPADFVMDHISDLLPTGRLIDVGGTEYDIRNPVRIGSCNLDHVFTGIEEGSFAEIVYRTIGMKVILEASRDFSHVVVYSPKGEDFFCIENQTCATDAHNLYDRGFASESGLKFVPACSTLSGYVKYVVKASINQLN